LLEIIGKDDEKYIVSESLRPGSAVLNGINNPQIWNPEETFFYLIEVIDNKLEVSPLNTNSVNSRVFTEIQELDLSIFNDHEIEIKGWKTTIAQCDCSGNTFARDYKLFNVNYERLNIFIDNSAVVIDGPGYTYIYSPKNGIVRYSSFSPWTGTGAGWDLLP